MDDIHYREYKVLLKPERFFDPSQFQVYWTKLCAIAGAHRVETVTNKDAFKRHVREVLFYDTEEHALYKNALILRKRTFYTDGWPETNHELTLKYRHPDLKTAADVDVTPHLVSGGKIKFKEEILPLKDQIGGMRSLFSHNCVLVTSGMMLDEGLQHISRVFPAVDQIAKLPSDARVCLVNNLPIEEVQVNVGAFDFGHGLSAEATLAVWRDRTSETNLIGEFAFQAKFDRYDDLHAKAKARSEAFYQAVQTAAPEWVSLGTTKTALVYAYGAQKLALQE
ncbi:MAG TPA: hypothetical protein VLA00_03500 [Xanthobacteraceae bacterium]|nr:hypothetical protein [Xanthobacteraceae bacterium]